MGSFCTVKAWAEDTMLISSRVVLTKKLFTPSIDIHVPQATSARRSAVD